MAASSRAGEPVNLESCEPAAPRRDPEGDVLAALQHPVRRAILRKLVEVPAPISPREAAEGIDAALSTVSYHFRVLSSSGLADLDHTQQVRGALQHFYVADPLVDRFPWVRETLGIEPAA
jgi:DNA-binding transcriptional ArsR family regulator